MAMLLLLLHLVTSLRRPCVSKFWFFKYSNETDIILSIPDFMISVYDSMMYISRTNKILQFFKWLLRYIIKVF